ncbi:MAG: ATP-binding protein [Bacteriovoracaceae bacterium]
MINILNIEDSDTDHELILRNLRKGGLTNIYSKRVQTEDELRTALEETEWRLVISDYNIPGFDPMMALSIIREGLADIPFIVVSGLVGEESVADMMKAGVEDFVIKSRLERLAPVVKRALRELEIREKELRSSALAKRAFEAKEQMLAIVYHDIKNPLSAIQLDAQMLELLSDREPCEDVMDELRAQAKRILRTVDRLKGLVADLLEKNNPREEFEVNHSFYIKKTFHDPETVLTEVIDSFRPLIEEKKINIIKKIEPFKTEIKFDKDRVIQVVSNLIGNALKFTPKEGVITLRFQENEAGEYVFSIQDNGPGLKIEEIPLIFEKYWTGGTGHGLGLYICQSIVEAHGGVISARNNPEGGACFEFTLPHHEKILTSIDQSQQSSESSKQTVFIVDDDEDLREVIAWALEKEGYQVNSYANPQLALDELARTDHPPQLIILDFHMCKMNGNEFLNHKALNDSRAVQKCPVLMISAAPHEVEKSIPIQFYQEILVKPVDLSRLVRAVKTYI